MVKIYLDTSDGELRNFRRALAEKREFESASKNSASSLSVAVTFPLNRFAQRD
jgi:hypothetical protein